MSQHTLGPSGSSPDFTEIDSWVSWVQANKVSGGHLTEDVTLDVLPAGYTATSGDTISGWDSNGGVYTTRLTALGSHSFAGNANYSSNALFYNSANGAFIDYSADTAYYLTVSVGKFRMDRLQYKIATANYQTGLQLNIPEAYASEIVGNIFYGPGSISRNTDFLDIFDAGGVNVRVKVHNNVFVVDNSNVACITFQSFITLGEVYHNTFLALDFGTGWALHSTTYSATFAIANNAFIGFQTALLPANHGTDCTAVNNATTNSALNSFTSNTGAITGITASSEFESATNDFRIKSTSEALKTGGAGGYLTTDIGGATRSSSVPSIGAWEFVAGGSIAGTASLSEAGDTPNIAARVQIAATSGISEVGDAVTGIAALKLAVQASVTETADGLGAGAALQVTATAEAVQADDSLSASGTQSTGIGLLSAIEAGDNISATALIRIAATFAIAQTMDNISATGALLLVAGTSLPEAADTFGATGANLGPISAGLIITAEGDVLTAFGRPLWVSQSLAPGSWMADAANDTTWIAQTPSSTSWTGH